jgi:DNA repair exonuclease SbcCD ATPase subunit
MNPGLLNLILERLEKGDIPIEIESLILAACEGEEELDGILKSPSGVREKKRNTVSDEQVPGIFLKRISVEGFRGIGQKTDLEIPPGPGLTLVIGRNGSGKSSFAESLEMLLSGTNKRWEDRPKDWRNGWRNLHHNGPVQVKSEFIVENQDEPLAITRSWTADQSLEKSEAWLELPGGNCSQYDESAWKNALADYRPFLTYNELGGMLTGKPIDLYRALSAGLGLEELEEASDRLRDRRLDQKHLIDRTNSDLQSLLGKLESIDDSRAARCHDALSGLAWNLDTVEQIILVPEQGSGEDIDILRQITALEVPSIANVIELTDELREADQELQTVIGSEIERDSAIAEIMEKALEFHQHHGDQPCPVCQQGTLDTAWSLQASDQIRFLRKRAAAVDQARKRVEEAVSKTQAYHNSIPAVLDRAVNVGVDASGLREAYSKWILKVGITTPGELADHLEDAIDTLRKEAKQVHQAAGEELDRRQAQWLPIAQELASWLESGRKSVQAKELSKQLNEAEKWLKDTSGEIRNQRFEPIARSASSVWKQLRRQSNVDLKQIYLKGSHHMGRVGLDVTVDGSESIALGVMSQGELHALALSLFIPRATRLESPFRFMVIDDPVQSMDPARVDGLARVLEDCAKKRQVIVFTHDARLPESVRRLQIEATVLQVTRGSGSKVSIETASDPIKRYIDDAWALYLTEGLPETVKIRAVPNLCRHALEAACEESVRRRRLGRGEPYNEVEALLENTHLLYNRAALAFFDDSKRGSEVNERLFRIGHWARETFHHCNRGVHGKTSFDLKDLIRNADKLAQKLRNAL